jgi:membrane associated rhomboid family serine protease
MIPLRDENPTHMTPVVNYLLIAMNVGVFIFQQTVGATNPQLVQQFAMFPARITNNLNPFSIGTIFTSMFMHAGLAHIGFNMLYLWIFGDNVEDAMGHGRYLVFYLLGGLLASSTHIIANPNSQVPTVGASGAIAAVLGAYLIIYPRSRIYTVLILGFFIRLTMVPAVLLLGFWFLLQLFQGVATLGGPDVGGVAFFAHIGGFVAGLILARLFQARREKTRDWSAW